MGLRTVSLSLAVLLAWAAGSARGAHEGSGEHTRHPVKTIVLDNDLVQPSALTMTSGDTLVFENHSLHPMEITYIEPDDLKEKIHCGLVRNTPGQKAELPWQLFAWKGNHLVATIPPGRFASVCSLDKGRYTFLAEPLARQLHGPGRSDRLPEKGTITVE